MIANLDQRFPESPGDELAVIVPATANTSTLRFICTVIYNVINYFLLVIKSKYKQSVFNYWRLKTLNNTLITKLITHVHTWQYDIFQLWSVTICNEYHTWHMAGCIAERSSHLSDLARNGFCSHLGTHLSSQAEGPNINKLCSGLLIFQWFTHVKIQWAAIMVNTKLHTTSRELIRIRLVLS